MQTIKFAALSLVLFICGTNGRSFSPFFDEDFFYPEEDLEVISEPDIKFKPVKEATHTLPAADANVNIYALPVGQGDLTVIQCPSAAGGKLSLIDAGSTADTGFTKAKVVTYLSGNSYEKVILTHPDRDHINYLSSILSTITPANMPNVYHSCAWAYYNPTINDQKITAKAIQIPSCCGIAGATACPNYAICNGQVTLRVIGSEYVSCATSPNGASVVTKIEYGAISTSVYGDFEGSQTCINNFITCVGAANLKSNIYRLSHHGSHGNDNRKTILDDIQPQYAFSSSGLDQNAYHHPRCEVFNDLRTWLLTMSSGHPYTCYSASGVRTDSTTTKAIWSATVVVNGYYNNNVLKFAITAAGGITVRRINVD